MIPIQSQQSNTMSSREIAELTAKQHKHVMSDIRKMLNELDIDSAQFSAEYKDSTGRTLPCFNLPHREVKILITGYDVVRRAKVIDRLDYLERGGAKPVVRNENAILLSHQILMTVPGLDQGLAASVVLRLIQDNSGLDTEPLRKLLPSHSEPVCSMNATAVGKRFDWSPRQANLELHCAGLQFKNDRDEWELTDAGRQHGGLVPFTRHGHTSYQILWKPSVVDALQRVLEAA